MNFFPRIFHETLYRYLRYLLNYNDSLTHQVFSTTQEILYYLAMIIIKEENRIPFLSYFSLDIRIEGGEGEEVNNENKVEKLM